MTQDFLFDRQSFVSIPAADTHVTEPAEQKRLSGQNARILHRLQQGPCTNTELASMALKYTSRLSDLRSAGYDVKVVGRDHATGVTTYKLYQEPK